MALLKFNYGLLENLPAYNAETTVGNVYITKDSHEMKVDLPSADGGRITISDFVIVENEAALTALGTYYENLFYYVKDTNQLKRYVAAQGETAASWVIVGDTSSLTTDIANLGNRITVVEGKLDNLEINAETVDTTKEIKVTTAVGNFKKGDTIAIKDLQSFLTEMLSADSNPVATQPSFNISLTGAGAKEVGSTFSPSYSISTDPGKYVANGVTQASGVTFTAYNVTEGTRPDGTTAGTAETKTGTFTNFVVTDTTNYTISATATHSQGNMPTTYLGKEYPSVRIAAGTLARKTTSAVTGYRSLFYGTSDATTALDSTAIRALTNGNAPSGRTITFTAHAGVKRFIVAIPASSSLSVKSAKITSSMNADATSDYVLQDARVEVAGAGSYAITKPYKVWVYQPASIASNEVHSVVIG